MKDASQDNIRCLAHICNTGLFDAVQCGVEWVEASTWMLPPLGDLDIGNANYRKIKLVGTVVKGGAGTYPHTHRAHV